MQLPKNTSAQTATAIRLIWELGCSYEIRYHTIQKSFILKQRPIMHSMQRSHQACSFCCPAVCASLVVRARFGAKKGSSLHVTPAFFTLGRAMDFTVTTL